MWIVAMSTLDQFGGHELFRSGMALAFVACLLEGVRRAGSSIAEEKSEGSFGLLLLTKLTGSELIFGKFLVTLLCSLQGALAIAPILALSILLGGVLGSDVFYSIIALVHALSIAIATGILISSHSIRSMAAMVATFIALAVGSVFFAFLLSGSFIWRINPLIYLNPLFPLQFDLRTDQVLGFWCAIVSSQSITFFALRRRGKSLAADWRREQEGHRPTPSDGAHDVGSAMRANRYLAPWWFKQPPIEWLTLREMGMHRGRWAVLLWCCVTAFLMWIAREGGLVIAIFAVFVVALWLCVASSRTIALLRQWNLFELLLTSPMGSADLIRGHLAGLRRVFLWPCIVLVGTTAALLTNLARQSPNTDYFFGFYLLAGFVTLLFSAPWIGMWFGMKAKTPSRAAILTVLAVVFVPRLAYGYLGDAVYFAVAFPIARAAVNREFLKLRG